MKGWDRQHNWETEKNSVAVRIFETEGLVLAKGLGQTFRRIQMTVGSWKR
jgi:hypothetical protein